MNSDDSPPPISSNSSADLFNKTAPESIAAASAAIPAYRLPDHAATPWKR
ncbi:hypothetical protein WJ970_20050 [Achromobacter xylosoxidans]